MDLLKTLQSHAEQVEVVELVQEETSVEFEAYQLKSSKVSETSGLAARVVRNGKLGFAASSDVNALDKLATNTLESAAYGDTVPIIFPSTQPSTPVEVFDSRISELSISQLVEIGKEITATIRQEAPEVLVNVSIERSIQKVSICNHTGMEIAFERTPLSIGVEIHRIEGDDVLIMFDMNGVTLWDEQLLGFVSRLIDRLKLARNITHFRPGKMPVIFSPSGSLVLGIPLLQGIDGKNIYTGISPLRGKQGEKLFDAKLTLIDDGVLNGRFSSAPYDDEGVPRRRNVVIENGILNGFLYDLKTAFMSGVESTGNGSRSLFSPPVPNPTNLIIQPGESTISDLISSVDYGILVEDVLGMGQGNVISGAFSNPLSVAFKIEKGEIVGRIKNASIADNVYSMLKEINAISKEQEWVYNRLLMPYIMLPQLNVVGKE